MRLIAEIWGSEPHSLRLETHKMGPLPKPLRGILILLRVWFSDDEMNCEDYRLAVWRRIWTIGVNNGVLP